MQSYDDDADVVNDAQPANNAPKLTLDVSDDASDYDSPIVSTSYNVANSCENS